MNSAQKLAPAIALAMSLSSSLIAADSPGREFTGISEESVDHPV